MPEQNGGQKHWYRPDEVARILEEPRRKIYRLIQAKQIQAVVIGRRLKVSSDELERLILRGTTGI